jgi:SAM-dependent methyltransferase
MLIKTFNNFCPICKSTKYNITGISKDFEYNTCKNEFKYVTCQKCMTVYIRNSPTIESLSIIYPKNYHNYSLKKTKSLVYKIKDLIDSYNLNKFTDSKISSFLDVGCSNGRMLNLVKKKSGKNTIIEGVEISEEAAKSSIDQGYKVYIGSIENIFLKSEVYDFVYMQQVIEHLFNPEKALQVIYKSMKIGGKLVIETPTTECLDFKIFQGRYWGGYHCPRHLLILNSSSLIDLALKNGFQVENVRYRPQPKHWSWTFHHILLEKSYPSFIISLFHINNFFLVSFFTVVELILNLINIPTSNMCVTLKKIGSNNDRFK